MNDLILIDPHRQMVIAKNDDPGPEKWVALIIIGIFFGLFLGWAALTSLDAGAYAHGVIAVAGNVQDVQHREGGVVTALHVKDGDTVKQGQPLLTISNADIEVQERSLTSEELDLYAERARLIAERNGDRSIASPPEFASLAPADRSMAAEALRGQNALFRARRQSNGSQKSVLAEQSSQVEQKISSIAAMNQANLAQRHSLELQLNGLRSLAAKGFAPENRIRELEREQAALSGEYSGHSADIAGAHDAISQARTQTLVLDQSQLEGVDQRLRDVAQRIDEIQPKLATVRDMLARSIIRAPTSGRVVGLRAFTVGGVINPSEVIMRIVPQDRELIIKAQIKPDDINDLHPGLMVTVRFPTLHDRNMPIIQGTLTTISADAIIDEKTGSSYFEGQVHVPSAILKKAVAGRGMQTNIQSGMPAEILIPLEKRSALQYLLQPITSTMWQSGHEH